MKKLVILSLFLIVLSASLFAASQRVFNQQLVLAGEPDNPDNILNYITNTGTTTSANYILRVTANGETKGTDLGQTGQNMRVYQNNLSGQLRAIANFNQTLWTNNWVVGSNLVIDIWWTGTPDGQGDNVEPYPQYKHAQKTWVVVTGSVVSQIDANAMVVPPPYVPVLDQTLTITSTPTGQPIWVNGAPAVPALSTPAEITNPVEGDIYSINNPLYTWDPVPYTVPADFETATVDFVGTFIPIVVKPNPAINPAPADGATIQRAWDAVDAPVVLTWAPNTEGPAPVGYKLEWNGAAAIVLPNVTQWETPALGAGVYTWKVIPYANDITEPVKSVNVRASIGQRTIDGVKGDADACPTWTFTVAYDAAPDYPPTIPVEVVVGGQTIFVTVTGGNAMNDAAPGVTPPWPNPNQVDDFITLWFDGSGVTTFTIATTAPYGAFWDGANWIVAENVGGVITFTVDFGAKAPKPIILGPVDPTLPVVLSSFTAVLTAQNYVQLNWITESETNMLGFRVYRSETTEVSDAVLITPVMIGATNTSSTQHYSVTDNEVVVGTTYNYWLESVDMGHTTFHGPQTVTVSGTTTPNLPSITQLGNAYPNPFRASTNISLAVKEGETATVTIYNILGQVVRTYNKTQGSHTINWDGRDARGNACGSGIYFYKLSSPSMNQTKKMVIVK